MVNDANIHLFYGAGLSLSSLLWRPIQVYLRRRGEPKNEALLFQSTVDIHILNVHKTLFQSTVDIHFQNVQKNKKNCEGSHSVHLCLIQTLKKRFISNINCNFDMYIVVYIY